MTAVASSNGSSRQYDIRTLANWILDRAVETNKPIPSNMAINKIVYFLYERLLVEEDRKISPAKIEAWEHGPVFRELYSEFKKCGDGPIGTRANRFSLVTRRLEIAMDDIESKDQIKFAEIVDSYLPMSAATLRRISHQPDGPWFSVWAHDGVANPGMEITPDVIKASFHGYKANA